MAAAALPPSWLHRAAATETRVCIRGEEKIHAQPKPRDHPWSLRLHGKLVLFHGSRGAIRELDHRVQVADVATLTCVEACTELIHRMLAEAPATCQYDLAAENWVDPLHTTLGIAKKIARYLHGEYDDDDELRLPVPRLEFDIDLPQLRVTLLGYSEPSCAICFSELDLETEDEADALALLPCSHLFHSNCIATWLDKQSTCPTCRHETTDYGFSFERSPSDEDELSEDE